MMNDDILYPLVGRLVKEAENHRNNLDEDRSDATDYYNGDMENDLPAKKGKSSLVSKDVRIAINKVLPSVYRTLLNNDKVWEFEPREQEDEQAAEQATDFINYVVLPECKGRKVIKDAIHDAMLLRNGVVKVYQEEKRCVEISKHTGLGEDELTQLVAADAVEVLEQEESTETVETPEGAIEIPAYSVKIRRTVTNSAPKMRAVPLEQLLVDPDSEDLDDALLVGQWQRLRRSDLVSMGYDKKKIFSIKVAEEDEDELEQARDDRTDKDEATKEPLQDKSLQELDYYELYVRIDRDDDGIAELLRMCFAGGTKKENMLAIDDWDMQPFVDIQSEDQPHQREGASIADDVMDIQKVKTVLLRETMDNIYWQNRLQPILQDGAIENEEAVFNPVFGRPIRVAAGRDVREVLGYNDVPFVADKSFSMMDYFDEVVQDRTGITDAASGMAPDALQNMTATASAMMENAGTGRIEMIVRCIEEGISRIGKRLLHLTVQHQDKPRTVRLRDEWVPYDPSSWNADMDVSVNTGLGAGTRERDMQMLMLVKQAQAELLTGFGPDNPFVSPDNLYNTLDKLAESAGFPSSEPFFTKPDPEEVQKRLADERNKPDPEQVKLQAQMQLESMKMQANRDKEMAQMEADLQVKQAEMAASSRQQGEQLQSAATLQDQKLSHDRDLKLAEITAKREIELLKLGAKDGEDGPVSLEDERNNHVVQAVASLSQMVAHLQEEISLPKKVIYDDNGNVTGAVIDRPEQATLN